MFYISFVYLIQSSSHNLNTGLKDVINSNCVVIHAGSCYWTLKIIIGQQMDWQPHLEFSIVLVCFHLNLINQILNMQSSMFCFYVRRKKMHFDTLHSFYLHAFVAGSFFLCMSHNDLTSMTRSSSESRQGLKRPQYIDLPSRRRR